MRTGSFKIFLAVLAVMLLFPVSTSTVAQEASKDVKCTLVMYIMNFMTSSPEPRINVSAILTNVTLSGVTDEFGCVKSSFNASKDLVNNLMLNELSLYGNFTVIRIQDYLMEDLQYDSFYSESTVTYTGLAIRPRVVESRRETLLYYYVYVLKSRVVNVSDLDVSTMQILPSGDLRIRWRRKLILDARPAVPIDRGASRYESLYLFPLNYTVNVKVMVYRYGFLVDEYSVKTLVSGNRTYVNIMGPILDIKINETLKPFEEEIATLKFLGLSMIDEERLLIRINNQKDSILRLIENRSYDPAFAQLRFLAKKVAELGSRLSNLGASLTWSSILVMAFIYAFSSLLPTLMTDDAKRKLIMKFAIYFSLLLIFLYSHNEFKIAVSMISSNILLTDIKYLDDFTVLLMGVGVGSLGVLIPTLISLYSPPVVSLSLDLSIRDLKRHLSRSLLTIFAFSLIIASTLAVFKISYSHMLSETETIARFKRDIICLQSTTNNIIVKDNLIFLKSMPWINSSYLFKSLYGDISLDSLSGFAAIRLISRDYGMLEQRFDILGVDPEFLDEYFNFSTTITKGGYLSGSERAILVPASLEYYLRPLDRVRMRFVIVSSVGQQLTDVAEYDFGEFIVKGFFDPDSVDRITLPDGSPLIDASYKTVIVPGDLLPDSIDARHLTITIPRLRNIVSFSGPTYIDILKVQYAFLLPDPSSGVDVYEKARELMDLTGFRTFGFSNGVCKTYEELYVLNVVGFSSIVPPLVIVTLIIVLVMNSVIYERRREIWTLAVLGGNPRNITNMFLTEALITGILSTTIGYLCYTTVYLLSGVLIPIIQSLNPELVKLFVEMKSASGFDLSSILVVLFIGLAVPVIGSYIPCIKAHGLTLLGRPPKRNISEDVRTRGELAEYSLPIRATPFDGEMLYNYLKDNFLTKTFQVKKLSGNAYQDGTFDFKFTLQFRNVLTECNLKGIRRGDTIYPVLTFPAKFIDAMDLHKFIYDLEKISLGYPSWREKNIRLEITRVKPVTRVRTVDDVLRDVRVVREQLRVVDSKLKTLEKLKATTPSELLTEYEKKYLAQAERLNRIIRRLGLELEPFYEELNKEAQKLNTEIERLNIAYKLGEIPEEEYRSSVEPLKNRLSEVQKKLSDIKFVMTQLKMPRARLTRISLPARRLTRRRRVEETPGLMYCPYCGSTNLIKTPSGSIICGRCRRRLR